MHASFDISYRFDISLHFRFSEKKMIFLKCISGWLYLNVYLNEKTFVVLLMYNMRKMNRKILSEISQWLYAFCLTLHVGVQASCKNTAKLFQVFKGSKSNMTICQTCGKSCFEKRTKFNSVGLCRLHLQEQCFPWQGIIFSQIFRKL